MTPNPPATSPSTDLTIPAHQVAAYREYAIPKAKYNRSDELGFIDNSDIGLSFLKTVAGNSRYVAPGWDGNPATPACLPGSLLLTKINKVVPVGEPFVVLLRSVTYIKFRGQKPSDGIEFITKDKDDERIRKIRGLEWGEPTTPGGKRIKPLVTKFTNFYLNTKYNPTEPAVLSFHRTSTDVGKRLLRDLMAATDFGDYVLPLYSCMFKTATPVYKTNPNNASESWFQFAYERAGRVEPQFLPHFSKMQSLAKTLDGSTNTSHYEGIQDETEVEPPEDEPMVSVSTQVAAPAAQVPPPQAAPAPGAAGNMWGQ